jgi:hypothetical protein
VEREHADNVEKLSRKDIRWIKTYSFTLPINGHWYW